MKSNRIVWGLTALVVLVTIAISLGTNSSYSQKDTSKQQDNTGFGDLSKYAVADYDASESGSAAEREERQLKNKRYDLSLPVARSPHSETSAVYGYDIEPLSPAIPFTGSRLIVTGEIVNSKAFLSNEKKGIYSEYSLRIETLIKEDKQKKLQANEIITVDRAGGIVRYANGQKVLYLISWQDLPETNGRYLFFLCNDDQNLNYKILTAYRLQNDKVTALDNHPDFREFNGMSEADFIKLVLSKK